MSLTENLRRPNEGDIKEMAELARRRLGTHTTEERLQATLNRNNVIAWVIDLPPHRTVGYCLGWATADIGELTEISVHESYLGRGLGRSLLTRFVDAVRTRGSDELQLEVRHNNAAAIGLYESAGFQRVGLRRRYYRDGTDAVLYSLDLSSSEVGGAA